MLQRIQTLYFLLSILLFASLLSGIDFIRFDHVQSKDFDSIDIFGISSYHYSNGSFQVIWAKFIPLFILGIGMILLLFASMMAYKKVNKQLALARLTFLINLLLIVLFVGWSTYLLWSEDWQFSNQIGIGYYLLISTLPITFFAYKGVLRDKRLLDSIDRIR